MDLDFSRDFTLGPIRNFMSQKLQKLTILIVRKPTRHEKLQQTLSEILRDAQMVY